MKTQNIPLIIFGGIVALVITGYQDGWFEGRHDSLALVYLHADY